MLALAVPLRFGVAYVNGPGAPSGTTPPGEFLIILLVVGVVGSWIVAPLCEEWVYRGFLLPKEPTWRAVTFNALLFTALHPWNLAQPVISLREHAAILVLGIALATTKKLTKSTWACVLLHLFINVAGLTVRIG